MSRRGRKNYIRRPDVVERIGIYLGTSFPLFHGNFAVTLTAAMPRSHWSAVPTLLFIYISQLLMDIFPPFGNLLPIIP